MAYPRPSVSLLSGILVTAAAASLFQAAPVAITFDALQRALDTRLGIWLWENPLPILPFLGGIPGALTAGYLTRGPWYDALVDGIRGVLAGTVLAYAIIVGYNLGVLFLLGLFTPSAPLIVGFRQLFSFLVPLGLVFVFESIPGSLLGYGIARGVARVRSGLREDRDPDSPTDLAVRFVVPPVAFLLVVLVVWWFIFTSQTGL